MLSEIILKSAEWGLYIACINSFHYYKKSNQKYQYLSLYLWFTILIQFTGIYLNYNLFLLPIYSFVELSIFSIIYLRFFLKGEKKVLQLLLLLAQALIVLDFLFLCDLFNAKTFYAFSKVVADVAIVLLCLRYYWTILQEDTPIDKELLLLNSVFIGYFSINTIIFLSINFLVNESLDLVTPFWVLNALNALFLYSFLTYMIWQHGRIQKTLPSG